MTSKSQRMLEAQCLSKEAVPDGSSRLFDERTGGMWDAAWNEVGRDVRQIHKAARIYGLSCYLQGVHDAAQAAASTADVKP